MINSLEIEAQLEKRGFALAAVDSKAHAKGYRHPSIPEPLYVKASYRKGKPVAVGSYPLVLHPDVDLPWVSLAAISGVTVAPDLYHNSNLGGFPAREHGGKTKIAYGRAFQFSDNSALDEFVEGLLAHSGK